MVMRQIHELVSDCQSGVISLEVRLVRSVVSEKCSLMQEVVQYNQSMQGKECDVLIL